VHNPEVRVLIVEDEVHLAAAITEGLEAEGFAVDAVHDGLDGLWRAREGSYDAIVLDVLLPGMNGYRVCKTLREEGVWTPILILTAKDGEWDEAEALDTGADDFLSKPFSFVVLLARLRALFRRGAPPRPAVLELGPLRLDPGTRRLTRDGDEIRLTTREFAVLEALMAKPGAVLSRSQLEDRLYGWGEEIESNAVSVYIHQLRRKLGAELIRNVRGVGYFVDG